MDFNSLDYGRSRTANFSIAICFAIFFFVVRFLLDRFVFHKLSLWLLNNGAGPLTMNKARKSKVKKCCESMWRLTYYAILETWILSVAYNEPWFFDIKQYFINWPNQELKYSIVLIYMCQLGFYLYSIVALLKWETRRKDFVALMVHHVITVLLISYSYSTSFFRIGSVILALHDASDVFLDGGKILKYSGKEIGASISFGLFAISWFILRLVIFPFWVIRASSYYLLEVLDMGKAYDIFLYSVFNGMLLVLLSLHVYWWLLIYAMIKRQVKNRGTITEDIRSDSEEDDD